MEAYDGWRTWADHPDECAAVASFAWWLMFIGLSDLSLIFLIRRVERGCTSEPLTQNMASVVLRPVNMSYSYRPHGALNPLSSLDDIGTV